MKKLFLTLSILFIALLGATDLHANETYDLDLTEMNEGDIIDTYVGGSGTYYAYFISYENGVFIFDIEKPISNNVNNFVSVDGVEVADYMFTGYTKRVTVDIKHLIGETFNFQLLTNEVEGVNVIVYTSPPPPTITNTIFDTLDAIVLSGIMIFTSLFTNIVGVFYQTETGINYFTTLAIIPFGSAIVFYAFRFVAGLLKGLFRT